MIQIPTVLLTLSLFIIYTHTADIKVIIFDKQPNYPRCEHCCSSPEAQIVQKEITMLLNSLAELKSGHIAHLCQKREHWTGILFAKGIVSLRTHANDYFCCSLDEKCPECHSLIVKAINEDAILQELATNPLPAVDITVPVPTEAGVYELNGLTVTRRSDCSLEIQLTPGIKMESDPQDRCSDPNCSHYLFTVTIDGQLYFLDCQTLEDILSRGS